MSYCAVIAAAAPRCCMALVDSSLALTMIYPFMKRFMQAPQLILGFAFSFSIPMAYVASGAPFDLGF